MEREQIIKLKEKQLSGSLIKAKETLQKDYIVSYGKYNHYELKKAISSGNPVYIENNLLVGYDKGNKFINTKDEYIPIEKEVPAIIIEDEINRQEIQSAIVGSFDQFAIINKNTWDEDILEFRKTIGNLNVGPVFLPSHSAVFNFIKPGEKEIKSKVVSMLEGITINVYSKDNYIDNCIHEIGHLFWRDCLKFEERKKFNELFEHLKASAIYEYEWERKTAEEVFCTIYKWYVKSILINKSFMNILEYEEPEGTKIIQGVFDRIARDKIIAAAWEAGKEDIFSYLNPKFDVTTGKYLRKAGTLEKIKDIEIPFSILKEIKEYKNDTNYIDFGKAVIPIRGNFIDFSKIENMEELKKASNKKCIYFDMDGVVADFVKAYKNEFNRDCYKDDHFTVQQFCATKPNFFRFIPILDRGKELVDSLKNNYDIVFITTAMDGMAECKRDKLEWVKENIGNYPVIFSSSKEDYVIDESSILIDDMDYNLNPWACAGGTAIDFSKNKNDKILDIIADTLDDKKAIEFVKKQLQAMEVELNPTKDQKESGNYKKGKIKFKSMNIVIENPRGSIRFGFGSDGIKWVQTMKAHYGYITGTEGADLDPVDCFIGPKLNASRVFIVNQKRNGAFDEHKVMLGYDSIKEAEAAYLENYQKGWNGLMSIKQTNTKVLRDWLKEGERTEPF